MNSRSSDQCGIIILAAGASTRLGTPKQLLPWRGTTLIRHATSVALESRARPVVVVLGAAVESVTAEIATIPDIHLVINEDWQEGIASSIRAGVAALNRLASCENLILAVCDQPLISARHLNALMDRRAEGLHPIVASAYGDTLGTPALFHRLLFDQLLSLQGDAGARRVISGNLDNVAGIPFPGGEKDIDTPKAFDDLSANRGE